MATHLSGGDLEDTWPRHGSVSRGLVGYDYLPRSRCPLSYWSGAWMWHKQPKGPIVTKGPRYESINEHGADPPTRTWALQRFQAAHSSHCSFWNVNLTQQGWAVRGHLHLSSLPSTCCPGGSLCLSSLFFNTISQTSSLPQSCDTGLDERLFIFREDERLESETLQAGAPTRASFKSPAPQLSLPSYPASLFGGSLDLASVSPRSIIHLCWPRAVEHHLTQMPHSREARGQRGGRGEEGATRWSVHTLENTPLLCRLMLLLPHLGEVSLMIGRTERQMDELDFQNRSVAKSQGVDTSCNGKYFEEGEEGERVTRG